MGNDTQQDWTVERAPTAIFLLHEADRLADQGFTDVDGAALPADLEGTSFQMPLTQELISDAVLLTMVHVNRTLRSLRDARLIAIDGTCVTILDFEGLSRLCGFENGYLGEAARKHAIEMKPSM